MAKINLDIDIPMVPNFITVRGVKLPVSDFEEETLREVGKEWTENLIKRAKEQGS